jgi:pyridoxal phosphate enzyme (YggS family)
MMSAKLPSPACASLAKERLLSVLADIAHAAALHGRAPSDVTLLAVSKGHPLEALSKMYSLGLRDFGENYAQECIAKSEGAPWSTDVRWHFIGHLQTNKVKALLPSLSVLHSLDRESLLDALEKNAPLAKQRVKIFVQLEVDPADENKHGANDTVAASLCERLGRRSGHADFPFEWVGFMGMGPADASPARLSELYATFVKKAHRLWNAHHPNATNSAPQLSLGMSSDLAEAIAAGSTLVRIGTALFGPRKNF